MKIMLKSIVFSMILTMVLVLIKEYIFYKSGIGNYSWGNETEYFSCPIGTVNTGKEVDDLQKCYEGSYNNALNTTLRMAKEYYYIGIYIIFFLFIFVWERKMRNKN